MNILITGGAGYIGSHVVKELLKAGYSQIVVVDDLSTGVKSNIPKEVGFIEGDFGDEGVLKKAFSKKVDAVMHFAASKIAPESVKKPVDYYENNVAKSITLLDYCQKNRVSSFIFSSSAAVYGDVQSFPITEDFATTPTNPYGWSKLMFEQTLKDSAEAYGFEYASLRYFNAGGADPEGGLGNNHQKGEDVISILMCAASQGTDFTIMGTDYKTKDGTCVRDLIHVSDLARAHIDALSYLREGGKSIIVNLGSEEGYTVREIAEKVKTCTGSNFRIINGPKRSGDIEVSIASSALAKEVLSWRPAYSLDDIVATAWDWENS
jgi:UDP-glucose 4-epimerase